MKNFIACSICQRKFKKGIRLNIISYYDKQTKFKKRWVIGKRREKMYICEKCKNTWFALVRNHLAIKTQDIIDE